MTAGSQYQHLRSALEKIYPTDEASAIAAIVMEHHTGITRFQLPLRKADPITETTVAAIQNNLDSLLKHEPLQYVINEAWFYGLRFYVNPSVLIPRPETEELVHEVIQYVRNLHRNNDAALQILDIGSGSGCIPVALKKECPYTAVSSIDISEEALTISRKNAADNETCIDFIQFNFLQEEKWDALACYDIIISNPPYITNKEKDGLEKNVREWEPATALFVPDDDPLLFYRKISQFAETHLTTNGIIYLECHSLYAEQTRNLFTEAGYETTLKKDMNGNDRMLIAKKVMPRISRD